MSSRLAIAFVVCMGSVAISPVKAVESAPLLLAQNANAKKFRSGFQSALQKSCLKNQPKKSRECACFAQVVTKRYKDKELIFVNNWLKKAGKSSKAAQQIVPVMMLPEMRACKVTR